MYVCPYLFTYLSTMMMVALADDQIARLLVLSQLGARLLTGTAEPLLQPTEALDFAKVVPDSNGSYRTAYLKLTSKCCW